MTQVPHLPPVSLSRHTNRPRTIHRRPVPAYSPPSPISKLPVEILSLVFVLGSEDDFMLPMAVSHVSSFWRAIALRTPEMWRRISLTPHMDMWRERVHRSKNYSLDIQVLPWYKHTSGLSRRQNLDIHTVQWYMHLVVPYMHRWRSLEVQFEDYSPYLWNAALFGCCSRGNKSQAPLLEDLALSYRHNDDTKEYILFSGCAPKLRRVTLDGIRLQWLPSLFGNLTHLDYTHHGFTWGHDAVEDVLNILQVSSRLVELRILFPQKRVTTLPPRVPVPLHQLTSLPHLTHLHVRVDGAGIPLELAHLFSLIQTPSLISLRFIDLSQRSQSFSNLASFFQLYSLPRSLRIVRIEHGWYDSHLIFPLLYSLPDVRHLVVRRPNRPDMFYNLISRQWRAGTGIEDTYGYSYLPRTRTRTVSQRPPLYNAHHHHDRARERDHNHNNETQHSTHRSSTKQRSSRHRSHNHRDRNHRQQQPFGTVH